MRKGGLIYPLTKKGYEAHTSSYTQHHLFFDWVMVNESRFDFLSNGERLLGVWLLEAQGVHYNLTEPFVCFDIMRGNDRTTYDRFRQMVAGKFILPAVIHRGKAISIGNALDKLGDCSYYSDQDKAKGALWRVEKLTPYKHFEFLAKYIRPSFVRGCRKGMSNIGEKHESN